MSKNTSYLQDSKKSTYELIRMVREGVDYYSFSGLFEKIPFSLSEWSRILSISERTLQRYRKEKRRFPPSQSDKIIQISLLYRYGIEVFGSAEKFVTWLTSENVVLGGAVPKDFLDNTFGIRLVRDELSRIEHGILA